jgi:TfoX/Sxy family transcriptional regulator of competence genes
LAVKVQVVAMKWEKMSKEAAQRLEAIVKPFACQKKPMIGHEVYWVNGNMFAGVFQSLLFFRLSQQDQKEFLEKYKDAKQFEPMAGRPMKDYVVIPESVLGDSKALGEWVKRSYDYTASLPVKKPKAKK